MKNKYLLLSAIILMSGCAFSRDMRVVAKLKDGEYGLAKGNGKAVYESKTSFSLFCKGMDD